MKVLSISNSGFKWSILILINIIITPDSFSSTNGAIISYVSNSNPYSSVAGTYSMSIVSGQLVVNSNNSGTSYQGFALNFPQTLDLTNYAFLTIKVKATSNLNLRIDYQSAGNTTNGSPITKPITGNGNFNYYTYSFTGGNFSQSYPTYSVVDPSTVSNIFVYFNPGSNPAPYTGIVTIDSIWVGDYNGTLTPVQTGASILPVFLNQVGFYPYAAKYLYVPGTTNEVFNVVDSVSNSVAFTGTLSGYNAWDASGEKVSMGDFSLLTIPGFYFVTVPGFGGSQTFRIANNIFTPVAKAAMKAYYFQRASTSISGTYGGVYARAEGHPDNNVYIHSSAVSTQRPVNTIISSPKGWYDAGDYNKYVVNSGISTYTLLAILESFPQQSATWNLNIPESSDGLPDILNEALWNIRWLLTMQDPNDGGVYHKLTTANFSGFVMPNQDNATRYVVQKSTAATLDFAALMAQTSRIVKKYPSLLPGLADSCLTAAINAWKWARINPAIYYDQTTLNNMYSPKINTGEYGDTDVSDEFHWAALELYITTKADSFYNATGGLENQLYLPAWQSVATLGYYSIINNLKNVTATIDTSYVKSLVQGLADGYVGVISGSPYGIAMQKGDFYWGSNGNAANQIMALQMGYFVTNDNSYLKAALNNLDYILGRNPTGYCFMTGQGKKSPMFPHHRPSAADGILAPIPGFMVGGPQPDHSADGCAGYPSSYAAKSYLDSQCSYSTNEVAINWNAPLAYGSTAIEFLSSKINSGPLTGLNITKSVESDQFIVYPNPSDHFIKLNVGNQIILSYDITDITGRQVVSGNGFNANTLDVNIETLNSGLYIIKVLTSDKSYSTRFIKQ